MIPSSRFVFATLAALSSFASAVPATGRLQERSHPATGWYQRASSYPDGSSYVPSEGELVFGLGRSTRLEPEGFTVGFFKPDVAIDSMGQVLKVQPNDFSALADAAYDTFELPESDAFGNLWSVKQPASDWPIDQLLVATSSSSSSAQYMVSVYGHDGTTTELDEPVEGATHLPDSLNTILTLGKEARNGFITGGGNAAMVQAANALLQRP